MADLLGEQLGNYRLVRLLGQGGFADVYLGEHIYLNTKAAIKVLQTRLTNEDSPNFQREARTIASLVHPHIVRVLDYGVEGTTPYLVMDYAPGGTLRQYLPKSAPLPPGQILPYVKQVAAALQYAHEQKIVHRDVKPENMLLGLHNDVLLSDFGIATASQSSRHDGTGQVVGTASYMAPEQIQGKPVTASDQYALGVVVYEWLAGERPFRGTFTEVASQHMFAPPPPLRQKASSISPSIEEVVMIALAKEPQRRFDSVQAFATAFEMACQGDAPTYIARASAPVISAENEPTVLSRLAPPSQPSPAFLNTPAPRSVTNYGETPAPPLYTPPVQPQQGISRRTFVFGMAGMAALVVAGSAFAWWEISRRSSPSANGATSLSSRRPVSATSAPTQAPSTQPTPTQSSRFPIGTTIFVYRGHYPSQVTSDTWSPDGSRVATASLDTTVQVWDAATGGHVLVYPDHQAKLWTVAWQPRGQQIASGGDDANVRVWDADTGATNQVYSGHMGSIYVVVWSRDGSRIASGGADNTVQVWNPNTGLHLTYSGHTAPVHMVSWSPDDSRIASASEDGTVQVWDANTLQLYVTYSRHTDRVLTVDWSHDGSRIVSGSWDTTAQVWEAATGNRLLVYTGHTQRVWSVAWSPDDTRIVSGSHDATAQIWNASTAGRIYTYTGHSNTVWQALWSPNGQMIASAGYDGTARVWQAV